MPPLVCLAEFVVRGSLALLIAVAEEAEKAFTDAVHGLRTAIRKYTLLNNGGNSIITRQT
jgi:hypothetical protein